MCEKNVCDFRKVIVILTIHKKYDHCASSFSLDDYCGLLLLFSICVSVAKSPDGKKDLCSLLGGTRASSKAYRDFLKDAGMIDSSEDEDAPEKQCLGPACTHVSSKTVSCKTASRFSSDI